MVSAPSDRRATRPGVTTMWIGYGAKLLHDRSMPGLASNDLLRARHQVMAVWCTFLLIPFTVVTSRLVGRRGALVAGGVIAVEPLAVGHSALLHTDAPMAMATGLAIVALAATFDEGRRTLGLKAVEPGPWWRRRVTHLGALAGIASALALLTKISAIVPLAGAAIAAIGIHAWLVLRSHGSATLLRRSLLPTVVVPAATCVVTMFVLWPALWVDPVGNVADSLRALNLADEATPRLFLGEVIEGADWRYYPVELVFRASTWLLLAIPISIGWMVWARSTGRSSLLSRRNAAVLVAAGALYAVGLVTSNKQYARYLLPLLPLAAVGIGVVGDDVVRLIRHRYHRQRRHMPRFVVPSLGLAALSVTALWTMSLAPYQISHVNPLVGGQQVAERNIQLGWGEGREVLVQHYLAQGDCPSWAGAGTWLGLCPSSRQNFSFLDRVEEPPRYVFRYVFRRQLEREPEGLEDYLRANGWLEQAVIIDGVRYAELWRIDSGDEP